MLLLDEECLVPKGTDRGFLDKVNERLAKNAHFIKCDGIKTAKGSAQFGVLHYAGKVLYEAEGKRANDCCKEESPVGLFMNDQERIRVEG